MYTVEGTELSEDALGKRACWNPASPLVHCLARVLTHCSPQTDRTLRLSAAFYKSFNIDRLVRYVYYSTYSTVHIEPMCGIVCGIYSHLMRISAQIV